MTLFNKNIVRVDDFLLALILYFLSERKQEFYEIKEQLTAIKMMLMWNN